ncbi:transcriptional activator domain [Alkaliphilus metalliredigens QYMF]|uniref:Transcriptional activator domain n=1 Tax=Alkaliphilus metalliredigens (strain QYMF) TaxID=293826 RepID=A6TVD6_ALKMQ|nr:AAA family ATPase [Alkaliphilus metalliredigens]ABR50154.1 transcriptional activator domain [Alkaliphilus metalliredigens QYMF]
MNLITVQLFNTPSVLKDGEKIHFPFRKAEALFYYLVVQGQATRDDLVHLLWSECHEEIGRKNLRNAMYKIRKTFDIDIIVSPQRSIVMLNPQVKIACDLHDFIKENQVNLDAYASLFLKGFIIKGALEFEEWVSRERQYYQDQYVQKAYEEIGQSFKLKAYPLVEKYANTLIQLDEYDERAYRWLMGCYVEQGLYYKVMETYQGLTDMLKTELGIAPDIRTRKMFEEALQYQSDKQNNKNEKNTLFFHGRAKELTEMNKQFTLFRSSRSYGSIMITGEAGIGKTTLKDVFLETLPNDILVIQASCYQAEENYLLKPWNPIFSQLVNIIQQEQIKIPLIWQEMIASIFPIFATDEMNHLAIDVTTGPGSQQYQRVQEVILGLFQKISNKKKLVLVFEDLQWMDRMSLSLLKIILLRIAPRNVFLLGTCRSGFDEKIDEFMVELNRYDVIEKVEITAFTKKEVAGFIEKKLPEYPFKERQIHEIYEETEGNPFFLVEYLNVLQDHGDVTTLSPKMQDVLKSRLMGISQEARQLINLISIFFDKVSLEVLKSISGKDELLLVQLLNELQSRYLIREIDEGDKVVFQLTHQKLRDFIYQQQPKSMRKVFHGRIASLLEGNLQNNQWDRMHYSKLIYHFSKSGDPMAALKYQIKNVNAYLEFNHELFPALNGEYLEQEQYFYLTKKEATTFLNEIQESLTSLLDKPNHIEVIQGLEIEFLHMKGRFMIREGKYTCGVEYIKKMIHKALDHEQYEILLKGYRQMIYYGIQTHQLPLMEIYIEKGLVIAEKLEDLRESGYFLRLKGRHQMMNNEYQEAEGFFKKSIEVFEQLDQDANNYALNIAAAYDYLGEVKRCQNHLEEAMGYYDQAIAICQERKIFKSLMIFYTHGGQAAVEIGDYQRAKPYLKKAIVLYKQIDVLWGRAIAEGYMTLLFIHEKKYDKALESLKRAENFSKRLNNPNEQAIVNQIKVKAALLIDAANEGK